MPLLNQRTQIAARIETVEGTAEGLGAADALPVFNPRFKPDIEIHARKVVRSSFSRLEGLSGRRSARIGFGMELKGTGVKGVAPAWSKLMKACGFAEEIVTDTSVTYTPASASIPSMTLSYYLDGVIGTLWGARGNVNFSFSPGEPVMLDFEFLGADFSVADGALLTGVSYETNLPPVFISAGFTLDSYTSARIETMKIKLGNRLMLQTNMDQTSAHKSALIVGRRPRGEFDPEMSFISAHDFFGHWRSGNLLNLQASWGSDPGNIVNLNVPACRYLGFKPDDRKGIAALKGEFELVGVSGDDEMTLILT